MSDTTAELSSIIAQIEELLNRITTIGDEFRNTPDSQFVAECNNAERHLTSTLRSLQRALDGAPTKHT